jgi:hypothetical protein
MAAGDDGLDKIAARYRIDDDRRAEQSASSLPAAETDHNDHAKRKPFVSPDRVQQR